MIKMTEKTLSIYQKKIVAEYKKSLTIIRAELVRLNEKMGSGALKDWERYKYARDVELYRNINNELDKLGQKTIDLTTDLKKVTYKQGYFNGIYDIDKQTAFTFSMASPQFAAVPINAIQGLINKDDFLQFKVSMKNITETAKQNIKSIINQGLIQGKRIGEISKGISLELGEKTYRSTMIAETETQRAVNKGTLDSYDYAEQNGVQLEKEWLHGIVASRSSKKYEARPWHEELNNTVADFEGEDGQMYFVLKSGPDKGAIALGPGQFGIAAEDINCTCGLAARTVDYQPPENLKGVAKDYSNFNTWAEDKIGADLNVA